MSPKVLFYAYVEDAPSQAVLEKIIDSLNDPESPFFGFRDGRPQIMRGESQIRKEFPANLAMAAEGLYTFSLVDLDVYDYPCPPTLLRNWLGIEQDKPIVLPPQTILRVATRIVESWIMADRKKFAKFFDLTESRLPVAPDDHLRLRKTFFDLLWEKGGNVLRKKKLIGMVPSKNSHIGPKYNDIMCDFVERHWSPERAEHNSPSLKRTMNRLRSMMEPNCGDGFNDNRLRF